MYLVLKMPFQSLPDSNISEQSKTIHRGLQFTPKEKHERQMPFVLLFYFCQYLVSGDTII